MVFSSTVFLFLFLPIVLVVYYNPFVKNRAFRNAVLLLASLGFYAWGEPIYVFLMLVSILVTYGLGRLLARARTHRGRKTALTAAVIYHVAVLFAFKYLSFFAGQLGLLLHRDWELSIALPIGISFYTFQMLSYLFDVYYGRAEAQKNVFYVGLYVALFPQLIAGPIVRYAQIERELTGRRENLTDFAEGMIRFTYGLGKKALLANYLSVTADAVFGADGRSVLAAWLGAICYTLQIYFDFSGYSDMAIGLGKCFGFHFPENFHYPYAAKSVTEFWRRWHISLSSWFRDYVYIPLGGNRAGRAKWVRNLFVVWLLTGIWHGANWTFLVWGILYFAVLLLEKTLGAREKALHPVLSHGYTLLVVLLAWVIFRADTLGDALVYLGNLVGIGADGVCDALFLENLKDSATILVCGVLLACPIVPFLREKLGRWRTLWNVGTSAVIFALSVLACVKAAYQPFIYFNF